MFCCYLGKALRERGFRDINLSAMQEGGRSQCRVDAAVQGGDTSQCRVYGKVQPGTLQCTTGTTTGTSDGTGLYEGLVEFILLCAVADKGLAL